MNYYKRALELKEETIANRRYLHEHAETGLHLENTVEFVMISHPGSRCLLFSGITGPFP